MVAQPPAHGFREAADRVVEQIRTRYVPRHRRHVRRENHAQPLFKIVHEQLAAFAGEDALDGAPVVCEVAEHVREPPVDGADLPRKIVRLFVRYLVREHMVKDFGADFPQQLVLRVKVRVKGASADVRPVNDVLHRDIGIALGFKQRGKRRKNGVPRFPLPSVHLNAPFGMFRAD